MQHCHIQRSKSEKKINETIIDSETNMMIHTTSESDVTSLTSSSPRSSPKPPRQQPYYVVQSPSRDSHEDDKQSSTSASASATHQAALTPTSYNRSPTSTELMSLFSRQSRSSSGASRVSGPHRGAKRKRGREGRVRRRLLGHVAEDEEEGERDVYVNWWRGEEEGEELSRSCKVVMGVVIIGLLFFLGCVVVWGATRPFTAQVSLKNMTVNNFYFGEGSDLTGVPTKILTVNCSLKMRVHNPATFFGIHVSCSTINLRYYDLTIASGQLEAYYQPKKSWRMVLVNIQGSNVPLYGAGAGFVVSSNKADGVPLILEFDVRSKGDVVGKLVKSKHHQHVKCSFTISSRTTHIVKFAGESCTYM